MLLVAVTADTGTVQPNGECQVTLTYSEMTYVFVGLKAHLREFAAHRELDNGESHPESEWQELRSSVGELIWRLEEALAPPGALIEHSDEAVRPAVQ